MDTVQFYTKEHSNSIDPADGLIWERKMRSISVVVADSYII